jgi:hypothetical protein
VELKEIEMSEPKTLTAVYKCIDGAHIFSSTDGLACGLYAASTDLREAFDDVPVQVKMLLKLNHGIDGEVVSEMTFEEFLIQLLSAVTRALESRHRVAGSARVQGVLPPNKALALRMQARMDTFAA